MKPTQHDEKSEQGLLSALLLEKGIYKQIDVTIDDFYIDKHKKIYQCICELREEGIEIDYVSVLAKIKSRGWADEISPAFLTGLADDIPTAVTANWKSYVAIIKKKSAARKLNMLAVHLSKISQNGLDNLSGKIDEAMGQLIEIREKAANKSRSVTDRVKDWVDATSGDFFATDCVKDLAAATERDKQTIRRVLQRLENDSFIVRCGKRNGCYRRIEKDAPVIDFLNVNLNDPYPIKWPFGIENYVDLYPGNVVVIAGEANAGKTALMLNVVRHNMHRHKIEYFSSEMGPEEFHLRLKKFNDVDLKDWRFSPRQRSSKFEDVIVPDSLNVIDYLEVTKDFYEVGGEIKGIFDRLRKGIAIIALQKKQGSDIGRGGDFTLEKPRLYMSMKPGELKIVKGKNWANPDINPNNMTWKFKLVQGCRFIESGGSVYAL